MRKAIVVVLLVLAFFVGMTIGVGVPETKADNPCYYDCINGTAYLCCLIGGCVPAGPCR